MTLRRLSLLALSLYLARLLAEAVDLPWYGVLLLAAAGGALGLALARARVAGDAWPALVLWLYVLWPWRDPGLALACGTIALLALAVVWTRRSIIAPPRYALECGVFIGALVLYTATLAPGLLPADAGEFQSVAARLAVAHPPGYPLYTLLAKAFTLLPIADIAWRVNWLSAVTAAAALALTAAAARRLSGSAWGGLAAALVLGTCTSFWATATQASIRPLAAFFTAGGVLTVACVFEIAKGHDGRQQGAGSREQGSPSPAAGTGSARETSPGGGGLGGGLLARGTIPAVPASSPPPSLPRSQTALAGEGPRTPLSTIGADRCLVLLALLLGLGIGHHMSLAFTGVFFALYALLADPSLLRSPRRWLAPLGAFVLSLAVFVYLPLADEGLRSIPAILDYALGRGFAGDMLYFVTQEPALLGDRLALLPGLLAFEFQPLALLGAALGLVLLARRDWRLALALGGGWLLHTFMTLTYRAPQTVEYMLPAYVIIAIAAGFAAGAGAGSGGQRTGNGEQGASGRLPAPRSPFPDLRSWLYSPLVTALILWPALSHGSQNWPSFLALARDDDTRATVMDVLAAAPRDAAVLSNWHWHTPMQYLQQVEGVRPDIRLEYVYPRGEPLAESWLSAIRAEMPARPVVVNQYFESEYGASGLRFEPLGREAWQVANSPRTAPPAGLAEVDAVFGVQVRLLGFTLDRKDFAAGETLVLTVAWTPIVPLARDYHFFVHVLGPDGVPLAQSDRAEPTTQYAPGEIVVERHTIALPVAVSPGAYRLTTGVYDVPDAGGFVRLTLPDGRDVLQLAELTLAPAAWPLPTQHTLYWHYPGGPTLVGSDYEASTRRLYLHWIGPASARQVVAFWASGGVAGRDALPEIPAGVAFTTVHQPASGDDLSLEIEQDGMRLEPRGVWGLPALSPRAGAVGLAAGSGSRYVPLGGDLILAGSTPLPARCDGAAVRVDLTFLSARPLVRDRVVSVHLAGDWFAQSDSVPALGAIPTLKWLYASRVDDRHVLSLPADGRGNATAQLVVYDAFTLQPLAVLDPDIAREGPAVVLGACER